MRQRRRAGVWCEKLALNQSKVNWGNISAPNDLSLCHCAVIAPIGRGERGEGGWRKGRASGRASGERLTQHGREREEGVHENGLSSTEERKREGRRERTNVIHGRRSNMHCHEDLWEGFMSFFFSIETHMAIVGVASLHESVKCA